MRSDGWMEAREVYKSWEGLQAWQWNEWDLWEHPSITFIPKDYSREPHHCRGVWFKLLTTPDAPTVKRMPE